MIATILVALAARSSASQTPGGSTSGAISGVVYDSIARKPLAGALVQVVAVEGARHFSNSTTSDSVGRYRLSNVPDGRFMLGFLHPMLDSLGLEPPLREIVVEANRPVRSDLAIPSPARMRAAVCGTPPDSLRGGAVVGVVRDARNREPVADATVIVEWLELSLGREGMKGQIASRNETSRENGWFTLCHVPSPGTLVISASKGSGSSDRVEVDLASEPFARREFYLGEFRDVGRGDSVAKERVGDGQLKGIVVAAENGRTLGGARVGITDGPSTTANDRGEWTLAGAPTGTRMLQVRAVGYYPQHIAVDVIRDAAPIRAELLTMKSVLDTVRVTTSRLTQKATGFEERRRSGFGRYLTQEDVIRRQPLVTSDLFRSVAGVRVEPAPNPIDGTLVLMNGVFRQCRPAVYINGMYMSDLGANEIDAFVLPSEVAGIEVYSGTSVPPQFTRGMAGFGRVGELCGSIVIWTRPAPAPIKRMSWAGRAVTLLGLGAAAVMIGVMVK